MNVRFDIDVKNIDLRIKKEQKTNMFYLKTKKNMKNYVAWIIGFKRAHLTVAIHWQPLFFIAGWSISKCTKFFFRTLQMFYKRRNIAEIINIKTHVLWINKKKT